MMLKLLKIAALSLTVALVGLAATAADAPDYMLDGGATLTQPGYQSENAVRMVSNADKAGATITFTLDEPLTFAELERLSLDFNVTDDGCANRSPRFAIGLNTAAGMRYVFAYLGPTPSYQGCLVDLWLQSGDLLESGIAIDTSQLGGTFYDSYENAVARYGGLSVARLLLIVDGGAAFPDGEQTVLVDNVRINDTLFDFEPEADEDDEDEDSDDAPILTDFTKDDCKRGGWRDFTGENGMPGPFRNQGACVSFFASGGRSGGRGN